MEKIFRKLNYVWSKSNRWHIVIFIFLVVELKLVPGRQHGFHCNDPALSHAFTGDTVSFKWLIGLCVLLPLVVMLPVERACHPEDRALSRRRALRWYREYVFGLLLNLTAVQTLKIIAGTPRPHFFDTCRPKEALTCQGSEFVARYECRDAHWLNQSDRSFPSGHTSLALHAAFFIVYYLHRRVASHTRVVVATQALSAAAAAGCAASRVADRRHHWGDLLGGAAVAAPVLLYTILSLCRNFETSRSKGGELTAAGNPTVADQNTNFVTKTVHKENSSPHSAT